MELWQDKDLYNKRIEKRKKEGAPRFVLHDGPPYANGKIHIGHALNKTLKDIIVRYKYMAGYMANYVPGWDTHGMPIERAAIKELGLNRNELDPLTLRRKCHDFALQWVDIQREDFKRLGVLGDWDHPYITMTHDYEAVQIHVFGEMAKKGYIYKGKKAVYWCPHCETALAEAEIEYGEEKSPAIFVKMPLVKDNGMLPEAAQGKPAYIVIWTTTPWTLPANVGLALHPRFTYVAGRFMKNGQTENLIIVKELLDAFAQKTGWALAETIREFKGAELENCEARHPFLSRTSTIILADFVTTDTGTGIVPGMTGKSDINVFNGSEAAWNKWLHQNTR